MSSYRKFSSSSPGTQPSRLGRYPIYTAREAQKRVESQLAKLQRRYDALQAEHTEQRFNLGQPVHKLR